VIRSAALCLTTSILAGIGTAPSVLVERNAYVMGTSVSLAVWAETRASGLRLLDDGLRTLEEAETELSTWREDSAISALNRSMVGGRWQADRALCELIAEVARWQRETHGAFDPTIGALLAAWDVHGAGRRPSPGELALARVNSGFERLGFDAERCTITRRADISIDVGAFGKGEALDRAARVLGAGDWMIDLGGQVMASGRSGGGRGWPVSIAAPRHRNERALEVVLTGGSLATSGGSERDLVVDRVRVGHILDPRTGVPAGFDGSVTVWHPRALTADILSTALYVMGPERGLRWAGDRGFAVCYMIPALDGTTRTLITDAFRTAFVSERR
jgi:thiamine biosynthesis lipoprotein